MKPSNNSTSSLISDIAADNDNDNDNIDETLSDGNDGCDHDNNSQVSHSYDTSNGDDIESSSAGDDDESFNFIENSNDLATSIESKQRLCLQLFKVRTQPLLDAAKLLKQDYIQMCYENGFKKLFKHLSKLCRTIRKSIRDAPVELV